MSLMTYEQARPWAKSIRQAVLTKKMPPWFADPHFGKFANDRSISQADIDTIAAWVDAGAPEGSPKDAPAPRTWVDGWVAGKPDLIVKAPEAFNVPAKGDVPYQWVIVPTNLKEDKWVTSAEVRPGDRSVIHHIVVSIREPGNPWMADKKPGEYFGGTLAIERGSKLAGSPETMGGYFAQYEPGLGCHTGQSSCCDASKGRFRYRFSDSLHPQRESGHGPNQDRLHFQRHTTGPEVCQRNRDESHIRHPSRC